MGDGFFSKLKVLIGIEEIEEEEVEEEMPKNAAERQAIDPRSSVLPRSNIKTKEKRTGGESRRAAEAPGLINSKCHRAPGIR